jgi:hypothetical protein
MAEFQPGDRVCILGHTPYFNTKFGAWAFSYEDQTAEYVQQWSAKMGLSLVRRPSGTLLKVPDRALIPDL